MFVYIEPTFIFLKLSLPFNDNKRHIITLIICITEIRTMYFYALGYYICNFYKTYLISTKVKTLLKLGYVNKSIFQKTNIQTYIVIHNQISIS